MENIVDYLGYTKSLKLEFDDDIFIYRCLYVFTNMGVSKNSGTPKWMVYNGKPY